MSAQPGLVPEFDSDMRVRRKPEYGFQVDGILLRMGVITDGGKESSGKGISKDSREESTQGMRHKETLLV